MAVQHSSPVLPGTRAPAASRRRGSSSSELVEAALEHARKLGASDASVEVSEGVGLSVSVRKGELENVERNRDKSLGVSVYIGQRRGNASTSDFSSAALEQTVRAAYDIARFTAEDPAAGLPDEADLATGDAVTRDLDLFHPWAIDAGGAAELSRRCEDAALAHRSAHHQFRRRRRVGPAVAFLRRQFARLSRRLRQFASFAVGRADRVAARQARRRHAARRLVQLDAVGRRAGIARGGRPLCRRAGACRVCVRARSRPAKCRCCSSRRSRRDCSALIVQATSGGALYRKSSFLLDSLGQQVLPEHVDIVEDPHVPRGKGSAPFDDEGVLTRRRSVVDGGVVQGYFLSSYSARKLGMRTTGNAGGSQNLTLRSRLTKPGRRPRSDAAQARPRPVRDRADGAGRQLRHRRLFARRGRLLGRERPHPPPRSTR